MTSQLNVDTIVDKAGSGGTNVKMANTSTYVDGSATQNTLQGLAKHWVNYDAVDQATRGSLNQSSLTDHDTGDFSTFYTNNMSDAEDRCIFTTTYNTKNEGSSENSGAHRAGSNSNQAGDTAQSTTRVNFHTYYGSSSSGDGAKEDHDGSYCATFGDLS